MFIGYYGKDLIYNVYFRRVYFRILLVILCVGNYLMDDFILSGVRYFLFSLELK